MGLVERFPALNRPLEPVCSVCIANYNGVELLAACIDSITAQLWDFSFEIIVHDDASTDQSVQFLRENYPQVELLASRENVGFCVGNNRMAEHARGEYLLLLNNDAALFPDALATLRLHASTQSPQGILTLPQYDWRSGELVDRGSMLDLFYNPIPNCVPAQSDVGMVIGACLWIPRALWVRLGGFPEWLESIAEDMYLCCHARLLGFPVQTAAASGYRHWQGKSFSGDRPERGLQSSFRRRRLSERNKTFVMHVMTPTVLMWWLLSIHLLALSIEGLLFSAARADASIFRTIYWPAILAPFRNFRVLSEHRASLQAFRQTSLRAYLAPMRLVPQKLRLLLKHGLPRLSRS